MEETQALDSGTGGPAGGRAGGPAISTRRQRTRSRSQKCGFRCSSEVQGSAPGLRLLGQPPRPSSQWSPGELKYSLLGSFLLGPRTAPGQRARATERQRGKSPGVISDGEGPRSTRPETSAAGLSGQVLPEPLHLPSTAPLLERREQGWRPLLPSLFRETPRTVFTKIPILNEMNLKNETAVTEHLIPATAARKNLSFSVTFTSTDLREVCYKV